MSSSRSLQVKAILLSEGSEDGMKEIRRFRVEEEEGNGMSGRQLMPSLLSHVHSVFNVDPASQQCAVFWKDEDDDLIQFSSEEELRHAMDNMADDTLRIYITVTERAKEGPSGPFPEKNASNSNSTGHPHPGSASHSPPHHHPHPRGPPPPPFQFHGPWAHWEWKKWKPMNLGGWKGGWKGGLFYGCPWTMGRQGYGYGWKNRGFFKHGWDKKMKKTMGKNWKMMAKGQQKEFIEIRQQVPAAFRDWVRQYVRAFYIQGPEAAQTATKDHLPEGVGQDFAQWLPSFLQRRHPHSQTRQDQDGEERQEGETEQAPDCLPPLYYRWLCLFLPRFFWRNPQLGCSATTGGEEGEGAQPRRDYWLSFRQEFCGKRGFGWPGKHGHCKKHKGGKHKGGKCHSSSDSDDSDSGQKAWQKVPKGLRKFVRMSFKQLRNGKEYNPKIKEKATRAGVSQEVQDFVEQVMLEWNAKCQMSNQPCSAVTKEMMEGQRTLPAELQREHFLWMIRFMERWDGGRCGFLRGWMRADSGTDDTSGDEAVPDGPGYGQCPPYPPAMGPMSGAAPFMEPPFVPPPPMYGCYPPPPPMYRPPAYMFSCGDLGQGCGDGSVPMNQKAQDGKECMVDCSDSDSSSSSAYDMVEKVTEGVKKM